MDDNARLRLLTQMKKDGASMTEALAVLNSARSGAGIDDFSYLSKPKTAGDLVAERESYADTFARDIAAIPKNIGETIKKSADKMTATTEAKQATSSTVTQGAGTAIGAVGGVAGDVVGGLIKAVTPDSAEEWIGNAVKGFVETTPIAKIINASDEALNELKVSNPEAYRNVIAVKDAAEGFLNLVGMGVGGAGAKVTGTAIKDIALKTKGVIDKSPTVGDVMSKVKLPKIVGTKEIPKLDVEIDEKVFKEISDRGFDQKDAVLLSSLQETEKKAAKSMLELAEKATENPRITQRPIDIVGSNLVNKVDNIKTLQKNFGKEVGTAAKALKGKTADTDALLANTIKSLQESGIKVTQGKQGIVLDFTESPFKNVPSVHKVLNTAVNDINILRGNAELLHNFKLGIDELVAFGKQTEGLSGRAESILKQMRREADTILDDNFPDYKVANDKYKEVRDLVEKVETSIGSELTSERAAAAVRRVFSNAQSRGEIKNALKELDDIGTKYGVSTADNLLDQALFAEVLENLYGTQAITSLQGEVTKAVKGAAKVAGAVRDPLKLAGDAVEFGVGKITRQTDADKIKALKEILGAADKADNALFPTVDSIIKAKPNSKKGGYIGNKQDIPQDLLTEARKYKSAEEFVDTIETRTNNDKTYSNLYERFQDGFNITSKTAPTKIPDESMSGFSMPNFSGVDIKLKDFEINYPFADKAKILKNKESGEVLFYLKPETKIEKLPKKIVNLMSFSDKPYNPKPYFVTQDGGKTWNTLETYTLDSSDISKLTKSQLTDIWNKANRK